MMLTLKLILMQDQKTRKPFEKAHVSQTRN
jgi:hypothetical protein